MRSSSAREALGRGEHHAVVEGDGEARNARVIAARFDHDPHFAGKQRGGEGGHAAAQRGDVAEQLVVLDGGRLRAAVREFVGLRVQRRRLVCLAGTGRLGRRRAAEIVTAARGGRRLRLRLGLVGLVRFDCRLRGLVLGLFGGALRLRQGHEGQRAAAGPRATRSECAWPSRRYHAPVPERSTRARGRAPLFTGVYRAIREARAPFGTRAHRRRRTLRLCPDWRRLWRPSRRLRHHPGSSAV